MDDIVGERGDDGVARIEDLTGGLGAHSVIPAIGGRRARRAGRWN